MEKEDQNHGTSIMIVDIIGNKDGATAGKKKRATVGPMFMEVIDKATTVMLQNMLIKIGNNKIGKRMEEKMRKIGIEKIVLNNIGNTGAAVGSMIKTPPTLVIKAPPNCRISNRKNFEETICQ